MHFSSQLNIRQLKWLLLLTFPIGYLLTHKYFLAVRMDYVFYNILASVFLAILLKTINVLDERFTAICVAVVLLLMGYFIRFYWITIDPMPVEKMLPWNPFRTMVANRDALFQSFQLSVIAFVSFCFAAFILLFISDNQNLIKLKNRHLDNLELGIKAGRLLLALIVVLMAVFAYLSYRYQIGEMGSSSGDFLPFRLKGVIFYARIVSIPIFILLCIGFMDKANDMIGSRIGILLLILNGVVDMFLRSSRSSLLLALLLLVFLLLSGGVRLRVKEKVFLGAIAVLAFLMVPVMTEYRQVRLIHNLSHFDALIVLFQKEESSWLLQFTQGLKFVLFRMPGIESLWCQLALGARPLGIYSLDIFNSINGIAGYLTYVIHPMKEANNTLLAPGFVGWLYLVGGTPIIVVGSLCVGFITVLVWNLIDTVFLRTNATAKAFLLWMLFLALTEGTLDSMGFILLSGVFTLIGAEVLFRIVFSKSKSKSKSRNNG
jgi:hypothetical protein